jgi:hypothetical protein
MALLRCGVCGERLAACDFEASLCRFHVGAFGAGDSAAPSARPDVWRCCGAEGAAALGCAAGCHVPEAPPARGGTRSRQPSLDADADDARLGDAHDAASDDGAAGAPSDEPPEAVLHVVVSATDTLAGLALRYSTTPEAILIANGLPCPFAFGSRAVLRIPTGEPLPPAPVRACLVCVALRAHR